MTLGSMPWRTGVLCGMLAAALFITPAHAGRSKEIRYIGPPVSTLNSYLYTGGMYAQITLGTKEGLVQLGPEKGLIPAQAERWEVSEDRLSYTFFLRRDNRWYDGTTVTARDYRAAFIYQMEPGRESKWLWDTPLQYVVKAMDFRNGAAREDEVGVDVLDDFTLRFRLARPYPAFLNAMVTGSMFPIHRGSLEKYGDAWHKLPNYQGNGPYRIVEWELNSHIILEANPRYNLPRGNLERIHSRFAGRPLEGYQSGEIDFALLASIADIYYARQHPDLRDELVLTPTSGLSYVRFLFSEHPVYWDARVRRAIALGFDKRRIVESIFLGRETPMHMLSTPAMPDWDPDLGMRFDLKEARRLLSEAGYPGGEGIPESVILIPSYLAPEMVSQFVVIAAMLEENLGIRFRIDNQELGVYADKRVSLNPSGYTGMCFAASGAPWPNPIYGTQWIENVQWTEDPGVYGAWWEGQRRILQVRSGMIDLEGGEDLSDFKPVHRRIGTYADSVMALFANGRHGPHLRRQAEEAMSGWRQTADEILRTAGEPDADLEWCWKALNVTLLQARQYYFQWANTSDLRWRLEEMRQEAHHAREPSRQAGINRDVHRLVQAFSWDFPLHVANATALVRPYVKGLRFCAYWWANPMYLKWINIDDNGATAARRTVAD